RTSLPAREIRPARDPLRPGSFAGKSPLKLARSRMATQEPAQRQHGLSPCPSSCPSSTAKTPKFNLTRPYLFGFDLSRHSADESLNDREFQRSRQIYTHPRRWGVPRESFYAVHDIYALGVILLEIGCWRAAAGFDHSKRGFADVNDEAQIQEVLVAAVETYLRHMAGGRYTSAVLACLTNGFEEEAKGIMGDNPLRLHRAFGERVARNLDLARAGLGLGEE
ncbi:hypothetical protein V8F33_013334, partial [Rhypophila sp. PSN 637]